MVKPGINSNTNLDHFSEEERSVIKKFSSEWYVSHGGGIIKLGATSSYKYFLLKPVSNYQELFNIEREIIVVFSNYTNFQPRTLDSFDAVINKYQELRIERVCSILISKDEKIADKIKTLLKGDSEYQIIIPFNFNEILKEHDSFFIRNRFLEHFYSRDLFAFQSPLKKDLYFFGRTDLVQSLFNRHRSGENSGLFGLRKTGKTSIIFGIRRVLESNGGVSVSIDCQTPAFHKKRWFSALYYVIDELKSQNKFEVQTSEQSQYTEEDAASIFEKDIVKIHDEIKRESFLLIFDEIEHITPKISGSEHWNTGSDFIFFWQTLRSIFQKNKQLFTYVIAGTNPKCVEIDTINGIDNPIFCQIPLEYIPPFNFSQTREMVRKLSRIMGLQFDETIYGKLTDDFGGHPFLIRNVCSIIYRLVSNEQRPVRIDKSIYTKGVDTFNEESEHYIKMILGVLKDYYNDEFEILKFLALGDIKKFDECVTSSKDYTNHLRGYGILDENLRNYSFKIESIKLFLINSNKYKKANLSQEEMIAEISERRNNIEPSLRKLVSQTLRTFLGEEEAKKQVLAKHGQKKLARYDSLSYSELFDANKHEIYWDDLRELMRKNWEIGFRNIFSETVDLFNARMCILNTIGRSDAHSKIVSDADMQSFRGAMSWLEEKVNEYNR